MTLPEARAVIDSMKGTPALLAVIVLQLAVIVMVYFVALGNAERMQERELALIQVCKELNP